MKETEDTFVLRMIEAVKNNKAAFYLAFIGVIIQFIHNVLAFAGTFQLFSGNQPTLLMAGEWILVVLLGFFFAGALFYFTIKSGSVKVFPSQSQQIQDKNSKKKKQYDFNLKLFAIFDSLIDAYFWVYIVFMKSDIDNVSNFADNFAGKGILLAVIVPVVVMLPQTIRFYSGEIEN